MGMDAPMDISTDGLLTLLHWLSPAYPIGSYAYSHGLEAAITGGAVTTPEDLTAWISDILHYGAGQSDTLFIAAAYGGAEGAAHIDAQYRAFAPCKERLMESTLQGAAFCDITRAVWGLALTDLCLPIAIGAAARAQDIPLRPVLAGYLHSFVSNLASVGMRLIPLGQSDGHRIIARFHPLCAAIAAQNADGDMERLATSSFLSDIAAMRHETQYARVYRT